MSNEHHLVQYSDTLERASVYTNQYSGDSGDSDSSMAPRKKGRRKSKKRGVRKGGKRAKGAKGVRITKGRLNLKLAGYSGNQKVLPSHIVRYIPLNTLKKAARKALGPASHHKKSRKGRKGKKGRKKPKRKSKRKRKRS